MSDNTIVVRDEDEPCEHGYSIGKCPNLTEGPVWCPGGKEIILEVVESFTFANKVLTVEGARVMIEVANDTSM